MAEQKPYNSPALDEVRKQIDALDNKIHDTLMERAALVLKIGEEKKKKNIPVVQPAREARMIRRLLERHSGALPEMAVVRIWRELVGAVSMLQTGLKVAVGGDNPHLWDMARDYFGSCLPMSKAASGLLAISAVRDDKANLAVLPWPQDEEAQPWWPHLNSTGQPMQIIVRLPHGDDPADKTSDQRALVVSKSGFDDSGDDHSFLLIQCSADVSRAKLVDNAKKAGIEAVSMVSQRGANAYVPSQHLMEVKGFFKSDDERCKKFADVIEDNDARVSCVGGFPVPPVYSKTVRPSAASMPSAPKEAASS